MLNNQVKKKNVMTNERVKNYMRRRWWWMKVQAHIHICKADEERRRNCWCTKM